ncbi:MAG: ribonuclease Z [Nitrososphaerota archaeon]|nr:ribonuclease Z [Aigarchaeota archaeon]MDW8076842.1 ribonuclease Z [Nitrososphaerota archaeon]
MRIIFLGTGGGMPSRRRGLPAIAIKYAGSTLLFDCGESTQRQAMLAGLGFKRDFKIFLTHLHGDHVLGLPGLLYTLSMLSRNDPVEIYGPSGTEEVVKALLITTSGTTSFPIKIVEVDEGVVYTSREYKVEAIRTEHTTKSLAYKLQEKERPGRMRVEYLESIGLPRGPLWGKLQRGYAVVYRGRKITPEEAVGPPRKGRVVVYTGDTRPTERIVEFSRNADVLIHEATFSHNLSERAKAEGHSTAREAAEIAAAAAVKRLYLFHISPRYDNNPEQLLSEAKSVFPQTYLSEDFMQFDVPYPLEEG